MKYTSVKSVIILSVLVSLFFLSACSLKFSQAALNEDTSVKTEAMKLFSQSGDAYSNHAAAADTLRAHIRQAIAFESSRKPSKNKITVQMWTTLSDTSQAIEHDLNYWKAHQTLSPVVQQNVDTVVGQMFDRIIGLEKARPTN